MKRALLSSLFFMLLAHAVFAQSVAINTDGSAPNPYAILDLKADSKGFILPRMSYTNVMSIPNIKGMLVFDTTHEYIWYNTGAAWLQVPTTGNFSGQALGESTAVGYNALGLTPGTSNTAMGYQVLQNTVGDSNTAVGHNAMAYNTTGHDNVGVGDQALYYNRSGYWNTAVGVEALLNNLSGYANTAIGNGALTADTTGSENTAIGAGANTLNAQQINSTAIGYNAIVNASNKVRIGNSAVSVIEGQVPFTTPSDGRYKYEVREDVKGLDFILKLRPVTYQFDVQRFDEHEGARIPNNLVTQAAYRQASAIRRSGFIAQEVEAAAHSASYDFSGIIRPKTADEHYSLSYEAFVVPLVKAIQEQQTVLEDLQRQIDELKTEIHH